MLIKSLLDLSWHLESRQSLQLNACLVSTVPNNRRISEQGPKK